MSGESRGRWRGLRREKPFDPYDWWTRRSEGSANRLRDHVKENPGGAEEIFKALEEQMELIAKVARIERKSFRNNTQMIDWGQERGLVTAPEAETLRRCFA